MKDINRILTVDEERGLVSMVTNELDNLGVQINEMTEKMLTRRYRWFTREKQRKEDAQKLKDLIDHGNSIRISCCNKYGHLFFNEGIDYIFMTVNPEERSWIQ
ncbi:MAG: hypothetical protein ISS23_04015 [Nanoarchaeota archaeon]|nr:hypothetical protein [Nanoarchaeota archaeon]